MNYKKIIILGFILFSSICFSQICGKIDYTFKTDLDAEFIEYYSMSFNNYKSLCLETDVKHQEDKLKEINTKNGSVTMHFSGRKNIIKQFFYNNRKDIYFKDIYEDIPLLVKENKFVWKWKLENKTKKIGSFLCNKATIKFRGRNYTAWYTLAIPVPFGPWKFKNLPGLILEVYDTNKEFHIFSNKVRINKKNCNIVFDKNQLKKAMNLKTYLKKKDSLLDNYFAMMSAKRPKGTKPLKRDKNCEDCSKGIEIFNEKN